MRLPRLDTAPDRMPRYRGERRSGAPANRRRWPRPAGGASIDELLDQAVAAINRGDREAATTLVGQVLAADGANTEAEDLLAAPSDPGEIRRLTIFFADLVDSTVLSTRVEPETYRLLVGPVPRAGAARGAPLRRAHRQQGR